MLKNHFLSFLSNLKSVIKKPNNREYQGSDFRFLGENVYLAKKIRINKPERVILKDHVTIQTGAIINSIGGLYVGKYSGIGYNCVIFTAEHRYRGANSIPFDNHIFLKPVVIRDFVWIGANVKIMPGVEIGEGAILGMGAVVTCDVKPCSIVVGNPARVVGFRNVKQFEKLKKDGSFSSHRFHGVNTESIFPLSKRKFSKELVELGLLDEIKSP